MKSQNKRVFLTIRQFQSNHSEILSEHTLRKMCKDGNIPGFYSGNRFLINEQVFLKQLCVEDIDTAAEK